MLPLSAENKSQYGYQNITALTVRGPKRLLVPQVVLLGYWVKQDRLEGLVGVPVFWGYIDNVNK